MKHQYVGDINDYRKYALLRALSSGGTNQVGVCWMLTPDDGGADGAKLAYPGSRNASATSTLRYSISWPTLPPSRIVAACKPSRTAGR